MTGITVNVGSTAELKKLARRLRAAGAGGLERELQAGIRRPAATVLAQTKAAVSGASFTGSRGGVGEPNTASGLRGKLAAATEVGPRGTGVRFQVNGPQVDNRYGTRLAKLSDTELAPRWRHPTFGRRGWTTQKGQPWFFVTIRAGESRFRSGLERAMQIIARRITG